MWNIYFGEWKEGRLKRVAYLGYDVLLIVLTFAVIFGVIMFFGGLENVAGESFADMFAGMGTVVVLFVFLFFILILLANLNIMAKRIRDMGLPAWGTVIAIILISMALGALVPPQQVAVDAEMVETAGNITATAMDVHTSQDSVVVDILNLIVFLALVFIPSNTFGKKDQTPEA